MSQVLRKVGSFFSIALLMVYAFGVHACVFPQTSHVPGGVKHDVSSLSSCLTACALTAPGKDDYLRETDENDDDEPQPPFYIQFQSSSLAALEKQHSQEAHLAIEREPPPGGLSAYIAFAVFRA
ncbi:MAG: hypothetical protein HZB75_04610 [Candidatus Saccharibacteria bacterium]|nr:MAG: hypothetical protein HZB75_04610 [Candidatus Saccharibacteria bacterium]